MAESKKTTVYVIHNNKPSTAVSNTVEAVVVDGALVADKNVTEHWVDTRFLKN